MKKTVITAIFLSVVIAVSFAQTPIYDTTRVYDTVTDADDFYLFSTFKPCFNPGIFSFPQGKVVVQEYVTTDTVTVYGVAIPLKNASHYNNNPICDDITFYQALIMNRVGPSPVNNYAYSMELVDSVTLNRSHPRFCWFRYDDNCDSAKSLVAPCYEFYFDTPEQMNRMMDTFYVGRFYDSENSGALFIREYGGEYVDASLPSNIYHSVFGYEGGWNDWFFLSEGYYCKRWGVFFPIIGFRCKPVRQYQVESYTGTMATVSWSGSDEGGLYDVRLVGEDGSDTTYVTSSTALVLQNLSDSVRYNVMVRKQCYYATSNYDTTVYSDWLSYLSFGTTILDTVWRTVTAVSGNPGRGIVNGGGIYMDSSTVTLTANSYGGYTFDSWNDGIADNPRRIFVVSDTTFTAFFQQDSSTIGIRQSISEDFILEPNPAHGSVRVLLPAVALGGQMVFCDMTGRELMVFFIRHQEFNINVSLLPAGTYLVKLTTPAGTTTKKLLVQ